MLNVSAERGRDRINLYVSALRRVTENWTLNPLVPTIRLLEKLEVLFQDQVFKCFFALFCSLNKSLKSRAFQKFNCSWFGQEGGYWGNDHGYYFQCSAE